MKPAELPVLYVDDERENLVTFRYAVDQRYEVLTANSGAEALELVSRRPVAVLVTDQRMPGMTGVELCAAVRDLRPEVVRVIITAYADLGAAVDAINRGQVARYLAKPWHNEELIEMLDASMELARLQRTMREMQLRLLRRSEVTGLGSVRAEIARQLRVPISALRMNAEQVRDLIDAGLASWAQGERSHELIEDARRAHAELESPLGELEVSLRQLGRRERLPAPESAPPCDVARVVRVTANILASTGRDVAVVLHATPIVAMDPADLAQVVAALLTNALESLEGMGQAPPPAVVVTQQGDQAFVTVRDHGVGIPGSELERVFDPHFSTREGGRGLGLARARETLAAAGGAVEVRSVPGEVTEFEVSLPVYSASKRPPPA